jgi:hypothetical protein
VATRFTVEGDVVKEKKSWSGITGNGGTRTYVTEGGFIAARYPNIYFIDPENTPTGALTAANSKNIGATNRICLASYLKGEKRYMIAAWGDGRYMEIPLADEKPYKPLWNTLPAPGQIAGVPAWGYSCFIDQKRKIFYSQFVNSKPFGINLLTMTAADMTSSAPNTNFSSTTAGVDALTKNVKGGAYSMAGDVDGNVYNGTGIYTMAHDSDSDSVWITRSSAAQKGIGVFPRNCLTSTATCTGFAWYDSPESAYVGPLSALKDGRIVGTTRVTGSVYIFSLKDKKDRTAGINSVKIGSAGGDPYMYTDFTGATLYFRDSEQTFKLSDFPAFMPQKPLLYAIFRWVAKAGTPSKEWRNIKVESRCYSDNAAKPAYEETAAIGAAELYTPLSSASCTDKQALYLDLKLTQLKDESNLGDVSEVQIGIKQ